MNKSLDLKNILIFRTGHLGDTLVSLPAYWAVRKSFPEASLTLLSNANSASRKYVLAQNILPEKGLFDDWLTYPIETGKAEYLQSLAVLFKEIRRRKFDAIVYLMTRNRIPSQVKRDVWFFRLCGIKNIIGTGYLLRHYLDPKSRPPLPEVESEADYLLNCLKFEDFPFAAKAISSELLLTSEEISTAQKWLSENCFLHENAKRLVAVAPGSKWESKIWSEERFYQVVGKLIAEKNVFPIVFGGAEDREKGNRLIEKWGKGANAAGELDIRPAAAALAKCQLYVGNDTGTMHLAAAVKTPCVGIFSAIDWSGRWKPFGENHKIIRKKVECEGCLSPISLKGNKCLDLIEVKEVYDACLEVLNQETLKNRNLDILIV
ncbi:MAG TPA: glycosyltransferase family 9 protein [Pyrinomonadaceae bacterium]